MFKLIFKTIKKLITLVLLILFIYISVMFVLTTLYPFAYKEEIKEYSEKYQVDPFLVASVINSESGFNEKAISNKNCKGLMQISEQTGVWGAQETNIVIDNDEYLLEPDKNIEIGSWYISRLLKEFDGNLENALAAYNAGSGTVRGWLKSKEYSIDGENLSNIPYKETENYVKKTIKNYDKYKKIYKNHIYKENSIFEKYFTMIIELKYKIKNKIIRK